MKIRNDRPRVWLTPARLEWQRQSQQRDQWQALLKACESDWKTTSANPLTNFALVGVVTRSQRHIDKAKQLVEKYISMDTDALLRVGATSPHGFGARIVLPAVASAYDWLYPWLTADERTRWADQLMAWADWVWLETNPTRSDWAQNSPGDNFYIGYLQSLTAALAVFNDHPRAQTHIDLGLVKLAPLTAFLTKYGGASLEGTNYGTFIRHAFLFSALSTATDLNPFVSPALSPWFRDLALSRWHLTAPDLAHLAPFGDQAADVTAPITGNHRAAMLVLSTHADPDTAALARGWLDTTRYSAAREFAYQEALWYTPGVKKLDVGLNYWSRGSGTVSMRSGWKADSLWVPFECGPGKEAHQDRGANNFALQYKGEWLTAPARIWGHGGGMGQSRYLNVILVGGKEQTGQVSGSHLPADGPLVISFSEGVPSGAMVLGEAARAYDYWKSPKVVPVLNKYERRFLFTPALKRMNVIDTIEKVNPAESIIWQLQVKNMPVLAAKKFTARGEKAALVGTVLSPANVTLRADPVNKAKDGSLSSWTVQVVVSDPSPKVTISVLLEVKE